MVSLLMKATEEEYSSTDAWSVLSLQITDAYESSIRDMWRLSDLVEGLIFAALALMLVYTVFVTIRFFRRYFLACRELSSLDFTPAAGSTRNVLAELNRGVGSLRSIASASPFLGLAGTCYGMLEGFYSLGYQKFGGTGSVVADIGVALVSTAAGLIVALTAAISYNVLRTRLEKLESSHSSTRPDAAPRSYGFAQTIPLRSRFSTMPPYALIAAPLLALMIPMFAIMLQEPTPVGLAVHLLKMGAIDHDSDSIVIGVISSSATSLPVVYVNSEEVPWSELGDTLRSQLKLRPHWKVYVAGEDGVAWRDVVNAVDAARGLDAEVVLLTAPPTINSKNLAKEKNNRKLRVK